MTNETDETRAADHLALNQARLPGEGDTDLAIRLLRERDEARSWAAGFRGGTVYSPKTAHLRAPWLSDYQHHPICLVGRGTKTVDCPVCRSIPAEKIATARREFEAPP